jgi:hypothetical protein
VSAVRDWIDLPYLTEGALFRPVNRFGKILPSRLTGQSVALIVKRWALKAGLEPALFAGQSLRAGLATAAAKAGKSARPIMKQPGTARSPSSGDTFGMPRSLTTTQQRVSGSEAKRAVGKER